MSDNEKQYLIWVADDDVQIVRELPEGMKLTTVFDDNCDYVVDISHWDSADFYEFDIADEGDKRGMLEGLVEHQTPTRLDNHTI